MPDRPSDDYLRPDDEQRVDNIRDLLPHRAFEIGYVRHDRGTPIIAVRCRCGCVFDWFGGSVPGDILIAWLVNHYDDMFLTPRQLQEKYDAVMLPTPTFDALGLPLMKDERRDQSGREF